MDGVYGGVACAAVAVSRYPSQLDPPRLRKIEKLIKNRGDI